MIPVPPFDSYVSKYTKDFLEIRLIYLQLLRLESIVLLFANVGKISMQCRIAPGKLYLCFMSILLTSFSLPSTKISHYLAAIYRIANKRSFSRLKHFLCSSLDRIDCNYSYIYYWIIGCLVQAKETQTSVCRRVTWTALPLLATILS